MEKPINHIIALSVPDYLFPKAVKSRGAYARACISRHALMDFNKQAHSVAATHEVYRTSFYIGKVALDGLNAYRKQHNLRSRADAILAILATVHAKTNEIPSPKVVSREKTIQASIGDISFSQAFSMIQVRG
jgi:hypothetical protein